jgi:ferredoxin
VKVFIEEEECIGCESCAEVCPEVFWMDEMKKKAEAISPEGGPMGCIEEAMEACPVSCIHWEDVQG